MAIGSMIAGGVGIAAAAGVGISMLRAATTYKAKPMKDAEGYPIYCKENLITHEEEGTFNGTAFDVGTESLYRMLYKTLTEGTPLEITPRQAARIINVIETVHAQNPLQVKF